LMMITGLMMWLRRHRRPSRAASAVVATASD